MLLALLILGGGGIAMTAFAWRLATLVADRSNSPWPVAYALYGALGLIGVVLTGISYVLGKRTWSFTVPGGVSGSSSGGQDDGAVPAAVVTTTTAVSTPASTPPAKDE